ncbi:hypothetical protein GGR52DRAFT_583741 [Hypoxylon sp. FL1284]|nr:hypothetical protein GGR52DRAFT_583741 [Hypoxylon sp. FL1284]
MAEELDSYDKVDRSKVQFGDWEALSIHEADSRGSDDDDSSQPGLERGHRPRPVLKNRSDSSPPSDGRKDPDGSPPSLRFGGGGGGRRMSYMAACEAERRANDEYDESKDQAAAVSVNRYSISSNPGSATSSSFLVESPTSVSFPQQTTPPSPASTDGSKPAVRFTDRGPPRTCARRPATSRRSSAGAVPTAVEWGVLFDDKGYATFRSGQFLRGLAKHIIDDFAPSSSSLVVTPEKLSVLYSKYRLDSEVYPFLEIFNSRARDINDRIADFFGDLDCQYHLVQPGPYTRPRVPALTPAGFAQFFTTCILAHPDEEFRRLDKIVSDVQIFVADPSSRDSPERFPRQLVRSQFPVRHDPRSRKVLAAALDDLVYLRLLGPVDSRPLLSIMPPPPPPSSQPPATPERRGSATSTSSFSDVRHCTPVETRLGQRDGYITIPATSGMSRAHARYLPSAPTTPTTPRYGDEPESRRLLPTTSTAVNPRPAPVRVSSYSSPSSSSRPPISLPSTASAASAVARPPSYLRTNSSTGPPPLPPSRHNSSNSSAIAAVCRRAQSPAPRSYRASAPDVTSASASAYYKPPAGYAIPPPPPPPPAAASPYSVTEHRDHARTNSSASSADAGSRRVGVELATAASLPPPPPPPPHQQQLVLARNSSSSSSTVPPKSEANGGGGGRRTATTTTNTGEKRQHHHHGHSHSRSGSHGRGHGHHHSRRRSAVVAVEHDRGPTWEEVLRPQGSSSSYYHRNHHRTESGGKSGGGGSCADHR